MPQPVILKKLKLNNSIIPSITNTQKRCLFHQRGQECKSRKSRDTWNNRQIWPWSTQWSKAKANQLLPRTHWSQQTSPSITKEDSTDGYHWMVNAEIRLIIFFAAKDGEALVNKTRPGDDYGSDHELLIAKFRLKLKKVGKTTRPFRYELNQIPYDYTVEVTNMIQGLRSDRQSAWRTMDGGSWHCTGGSNKDHPQEKNAKR